jgi:hypothetical protein
MSKRSDTKWSRRDKKRHKKKHGMRISGRSIFLLDELLLKKLKRKKKDDGEEEG